MTVESNSFGISTVPNKSMSCHDFESGIVTGVCKGRLIAWQVTGLSHACRAVEPWAIVHGMLFRGSTVRGAFGAL